MTTATKKLTPKEYVKQLFEEPPRELAVQAAVPDSSLDTVFEVFRSLAELVLANGPVELRLEVKNS